MPLIDEDQLRTLVSEGDISALTIDTNIFVEKGLQFKSTTLQSISQIKGRGFEFLLSDTVVKEVEKS